MVTHVHNTISSSCRWPIAGRPLIIGAMLAVFICFLVSLPGQAIAGSTTGFRFALHGTQGYKIQIIGSSEGIARLVASKGHAAAGYTTDQAHFDGKRFTATFGNLGQVATTFSPSKRIKNKGRPTARTGCALEHAKIVGGQFIGQIRFRGEHNFTRLNTSHAQGRVITLQRSGCNHRLSNRPSTIEEEQGSNAQKPKFKAVGLAKRGTLTFRAGQDAMDELTDFVSGSGADLKLGKLPRGEVPFSVMSFEEKQGMSIFRLAAARGPSTTFKLNLAPTTATLTPPAPFSGVGRFANCPSATWKGSLAVSLPGAGKVSLTTKRLFIFPPNIHPVRPCL